MPEWLGIVIGLVLTVGTGLFVASEFALVNLDRNELEERRDRGQKRLDPTISALRITSTHLSGAQLGITLTTLLTGYTFEPAISSLLSEPLRSIGVPEGIVPGIGAVVGVVIATVFSMVIGELVPKNFALALPLKTAQVVVPFQIAFTTVFKPVIVLFNNTANALIRSFGIEPKEELSGARSAGELGSLVRRSALEGTLDRDHADLLHRTLRFSSRSVADVMTPRVRMASVSLDSTADEVVQIANRTGFSRFPVLGRDSDDVRGVLHVKHAFALAPELRSSATAESLMVPPMRVPETARADALLAPLRSSGLAIAVVVDEYGGTAGVVTLEDLVEEIVGELEDEHDRSRAGVIRTGRSATFGGELRPDEVVERLGVSVPEGEDYDTVAGFLSSRLGRLPELGDEVAVEGGVLRVDRVAANRVDRVRFTPDTDGGAATAASIRAEGAVHE
ncbi:Hemolysin, contains CBS domains [Rathayibacter oskolensis]|uniref:Hemolysin, contains CBS domains n=1 Tax=Rathayibacter oskolensis TaxID=1891671 RepID=A0A1X7N4W4_9MICO|nr:hemolysin family protein [Rathayibacter oskolensis]SMH31880.1 Hemolysin, contains CBS domains [Rathayibacter oskolensis]